MNETNEHLSIEEIERLLGLGPVAPSGVAELRPLDSAKRHLEECETCKRLASIEGSGAAALAGLAMAAASGQRDTCPNSEVLYRIAGGLLGERECEAALSHAAHCDHCGPLLRDAIDAMKSEPTSLERDVLAPLRTNQPAFLDRLSKTLASVSSSTANVGVASFRLPAPSTLQNRGTSLTRYYQIAAAVALLVATFAGIRWLSQPARVETLLEDAYGRYRTTALRMPGAAYAPDPTTRGPREPSQHRPVKLVVAELIIDVNPKTKFYSTNGNEKVNVNWLQAKAHMELINRDYDAAIKTLDVALERNAQSSSLLRDMGMAYFERAEPDPRSNPHPTDSHADYQKAYEWLGRSLALNPDDPVALFNRAIAAERAMVFTQAREDWKHYLRIETDPDWISEAQNRLANLDLTHPENKGGARLKIESPGYVATELQSGQPSRIAEIDGFIENYQKLALEQWIPELVAVSGSNASRKRSLERAADSIGNDLLNIHNDMWMSNFLAAPFTPTRTYALSLLIQAIRSNASGDYDRARLIAQQSELKFKDERDSPGHLRAALELVYSERLAGHASSCYAQSKTLLANVVGRHYPWIEIQATLEAAACAAQTSRIDEAIRQSRVALDLASQSKYTIAYLRATVFAADLTPNLAERLDLLNRGLVIYWSGNYEPMRGYSLYAVMDTTADSLGLWLFDEAVIKTGLSLLVDDSDVTLRGIEEYRLARAQIATGEFAESRLSSARASELLSRSDSKELRASFTVELAQAYETKGDYHAALELLDSIQPKELNFTDDLILAKYHSTRAAALLGERRALEAESELTASRQIALRGLRSIFEERRRLEWIETFSGMYKSLAYMNLRANPTESFVAWESYKGASLEQPGGQDRVAPQEFSLRQIPSWSDNGTLFVSYVAFPEGIATFTYDGQQVRGNFTTIAVASLESRLNRFTESCSDPESDITEVASEGRELYKLLIGPLREQLRGRSRLIFETDRSMGTVPFEAFIDENGRNLGDAFEIEFTPGLEYIARMRPPGQISRTSDALVVGQGDRDDEFDLPALPDATTEAHAVAGHFDRPQILMNADANLTKLLSVLPNAELFHFAGHAVAAARVNGLVLTGSSRLMGADAFSGKTLLRAQLVVLSACGTANGVGSTINDPNSLARNVLASGVPTVVASRWVVDSAAAREWMSVFYDELLKGNSPSSSAQSARRKLSAQHKWQHPFFWSAFGVFV